MAWDHLSITRPHLVYIILGGFTSLFMLCSSFIKERMYIGEATVATLCGLIFGPHAANLINPETWGSVDIVTLEFSRIVLVVQCFAVGVELPKFYMEKHWRSVVFLLVPVMTFGWLVTSLFVWWMVPPLNWLESLVVAACVTATDPVLASSVVGKGKFAKRVPKHLRDLLSAESGCNDGMAFPFVYLSLYLIQDRQSAREVSFHWIVFTILYECIFGAVYGFVIGYFARHGIKYAERHDLIDRESFLVFYFVLALFCAGSGSILGVDDLLVGFACGVGFSNDGWFTQQTEESHVSNVIDLLLNLAYFVYLGTVIPWEEFNNAEIGLSAWRLTIIAIFVILFRRIPIMMALYRIIPDIKSWREALFAGHFGPIGVGAIFVALLARGELEHDNPVPLSSLPSPDAPHYTLLTLVWPIVTFLVVSSIIVHGSSIAVFTLGKHINTLTITMSYTTANDDGPSWMNRLPRISSQSRSQARANMSDTDLDDLKLPDMPPGTLPPIGIPGQFLRRVKEEDAGGSSRPHSRSSSVTRSRHRRSRRWDDGLGPGGPISQSAIFPQRRTQSDMMSPLGSPTGEATTTTSPRPTTPERRASASARPADEGGSNQQRGRGGDETRGEEAAAAGEGGLERSDKELTMLGGSGGQSSQDRDQDQDHQDRRSRTREQVEVYDEHDHIIVENEDGDVLAVEPPLDDDGDQTRTNKDHAAALMKQLRAEAGPSGWNLSALKERIGKWRDEEVQKRQEKKKEARKHEPARAYQFGNTIIVEDVDGEVLKKYELPGNSSSSAAAGAAQGGGDKNKNNELGAARATNKGFPPSGEPSSLMQRARKKSMAAAEQEEEDDRHIRFTIGGVGRRLTKDNFIHEMQNLDMRTRREVVDKSDASNMIKDLAKQEPTTTATTPGGSSTTKQAARPPFGSGGGSSESRRAKSKDVKQSASLTPSFDRTSPGNRSPAGNMSSGSGSNDETDDNKSLTPAERAGGGDAKRPARARADSGGSGGSSSREVTETAVERRRRMAALQGVGGSSSGGSGSGSGSDNGNNNKNGNGSEQRETPAERRRRSAALGIMGAQETAGGGQADDDDSEDDDTVRVPPTARRGIRFAEAPSKSEVP